MSIFGISIEIQSFVTLVKIFLVKHPFFCEILYGKFLIGAILNIWKRYIAESFLTDSECDTLYTLVEFHSHIVSL